MYVPSLALDGGFPRRSFGRSQQPVVVIAAALALVLFVVARTGVAPMRLTAEPPASASSSPASAVSNPGGGSAIDPAAVAERGSHTISAAGPDGTLAVADDTYRATFDGAGFSFLPSGSAAPVTLALTGIERGGHPLVLDPGAWAADANVTERTVAPTATERVTARAGEVEWDVDVTQAPAGRGDLTVRAALAGAAGPAVVARGDDGSSVLRVPTADGSVDMGAVVVLDATGAEVFRGLPSLEHGTIVLRVPDPVLQTATYPLTIDPTVTATTVITNGAKRSYPAMASDGNQYLVVWQQAGTGGFLDIWGARVSTDGVGVGAAFRISLSSRTEQYPDVAWNGTNFLVVWEDAFNLNTGDYDIRGQLVNSVGALVGTEVPLATPGKLQGNPAIAAGTGGQFFVAWNDNRNGPVEIYGTRVDANGTRLSTSGDRLNVRTTDAVFTDLVPDVAWNGTKYLVVWQERFDASNGTFWAIWGRYAFPDGTLSDDDNTIGGTYDGGVYTDPAVASDGKNFFVAYESGTDVRGSVVDASYLPRPISFNSGIAITTASDVQSDPAIAYNGDYLVAWRDRRAPPDADVYANRVGADGTVRDGNGFTIVATTQEEDTPAVAKGSGSGKWGVGYESGVEAAQGIHLRVASK